MLRIIASCCVGAASLGQPGDAACDGARMLTETVRAIQSEALGRERVDWERELARLNGTLSQPAGSGEARSAIDECLALLGDPHSRYVPVVKAPPERKTVEEKKPDAASAKAMPRIPTVPEGLLLEGGVAYVLLPMRSVAERAVQDEYVSAGRRVIAELAAKEPKGWVVDLRLNGGGDVWPMLAALAPLLGDGPQLSSAGAMSMTFGLTGGSAWLENAQGRSVRYEAPIEANAIGVERLAVLIGPWTMSSGESIAIALKGRGAKLFGEPTAGLTTVTQTYTLCDGSTLILPVSRMGDKHGAAVLGKMEPDEAVAIGEWPLADDACAKAAAGWVRKAQQR